MENFTEWLWDSVLIPLIDGVFAPFYFWLTDGNGVAYIMAYVLFFQFIGAIYLSTKLLLKLQIFNAVFGLFWFTLSPSTTRVLIRDIYSAIRWIARKVFRRKNNAPQTLEL